jgi:hypothetical protein
MGIFSKKQSQPAFKDYHGNLETRHWIATCGYLKWSFEVELHTDNPPSIRYKWISGERNRITETTFVTALRYLHGAYGWRYIEVVDKDERDRAAATTDEELIEWKVYENLSVREWEPPLFGFGEPMTKG